MKSAATTGSGPGFVKAASEARGGSKGNLDLGPGPDAVRSFEPAPPPPPDSKTPKPPRSSAAQPRDDSFAGETTRGDKTPHLQVKYRTIVADPPWDVGRASTNWGRDAREPIELDYPTMDVEDIAALPVAALAERNAHLYLWTINAYVEDAYEIARDWGFRPIRLLTWAKQPIGMAPGGTFSSTSEFIIFCRRGSLRAVTKVDRSWFDWPRQQRHSAKPEAFMDLVERVSPAPRLEMFSRRARLGWDTWGDEALHGTEAVA